MMLKRFGNYYKCAFIFLSISLLMVTNDALGSTLDIYVYYDETPASHASIYIDSDNFLGKTDSNGTLKDINISPGSHTVIAKWQDSNGQQQSGKVSFTATPGSYTMKRLDLKNPRNLGWIWQFVKNING